MRTISEMEGLWAKVRQASDGVSKSPDVLIKDGAFRAGIRRSRWGARSPARVKNVVTDAAPGESRLGVSYAPRTSSRDIAASS